MSDEELRALEREIVLDPAALEPRRRHAQLLLRRGEDDRALAALDLAWRLGAEDLREDLARRLLARRVEIPERGVTLGYVPGGPFAMGLDEGDEDAKPLHLVHLSPFYVALGPALWRTVDGFERFDTSGWDPQWRERVKETPASLRYEEAARLPAWLDRRAVPPGLRGRWALPTEAQWERVFRASYLRTDGASPYGVVPSTTHPGRVAAGVTSAFVPEWTACGYDPDVYKKGPRRDPVVPVLGGAIVVRGVPLPHPHFATYREAATAEGRVDLGGRLFPTMAAIEGGLGTRLVFLPDATSGPVSA